MEVSIESAWEGFYWYTNSDHKRIRAAFLEIVEEMELGISPAEIRRRIENLPDINYENFGLSGPPPPR